MIVFTGRPLLTLSSVAIEVFFESLAYFLARRLLYTNVARFVKLLNHICAAGKFNTKSCVCIKEKTLNVAYFLAGGFFFTEIALFIELLQLFITL